MDYMLHRQMHSGRGQRNEGNNLHESKQGKKVNHLVVMFLLRLKQRTEASEGKERPQDIDCGGESGKGHW